MANDLTPMMKERLEKWRQNTLSVKSEEKVKSPSRSNYRQVRRDYGDDMRDFEKKEEASWAKELQNNAIYRGYR